MKLAEVSSTYQEPMLVAIINQRLLAGDTVYIDIERNIRQQDGSTTRFLYKGVLTNIDINGVASAVEREVVQGDHCVSIPYVKTGISATKGYKGSSRCMLAVGSFDDLYTLVKGTSKNVWRLVNA